jgi:hypothetical protein
MCAEYDSTAYRKSTLVDELELLLQACMMEVKRTIKARLKTISYLDMKAAVEKSFGKNYSYSCHGDMFEITRHIVDKSEFYIKRSKQ